MKSLLGTIRTLQAIAVALIGLTSLAVLGGCAVGAYPIVATVSTAPSTPTTPTTPVTPSTPPTPTIPSLPQLVAINNTTGMFYVSNGPGNTVSVFDATTNKLLNTITFAFDPKIYPGGTYPAGIAVNEGTNTIYVANYASKTLSVIDGSTNTVTATLSSVGPEPELVAVNPVTNKIYVTEGYGVGQDMYAVDGATNQVSATYYIRGGSLYSLAINTKTNTIYVSTDVGVVVINGVDNSTTATVASPSGYGVGVDETTNTVYAANGSGSGGGNNTITVIDGATNEVKKNKDGSLQIISLAAQPGSLAVDQLTHMVYVTLPKTDSVSVVDVVANSVVGTMSLVNNPTAITANPTKGLVYVAEGSSVAIIKM